MASNHMEILILNKTFLSCFPYFGLAGSFFIILAVLLPIPFYVGKQQENYSFLNHFISELGEVGTSAAARLFNTGLILGGIALIPFMIGLGMILGNLPSMLGVAAGICASIACTLIGVFPMNSKILHAKAALLFFRAALVTISLFTLGIFFQPSDQQMIPLTVNTLGIFCVLLYALILFMASRLPADDSMTDFPDPEVFDHRPSFWLLPTLEWAIFFSTIAWFLSTGLILIQ